MSLLEAYSFRIRRKGKAKHSIIPLRKFDGKSDLIQMVGDSVARKSISPETIELLSRCIISENVNRDADSVAGRIRVGEYGKAAPLINVKTKQKTYDKARDDAELVPHFFYFFFPAGESTGILLVERRGQSGIFSLLSGIVEQEFNNAHPQFNLVFKPLMPSTVLNKILADGVLCEARFVSHKIPSDIADKLLVGGSEEDHQYEVIIRAKSQLRRNFFADLVSGKKSLEKILEDHTQIPFDGVKIEVEFGGRRRTVDLGNLGRLKASFDLDTSALEDSSGFPRVALLAKEAREIATTLSSSLSKP